MELPSTIDWLSRQLSARKIMCIHSGLRSVISSVRVGLVYLHLQPLLQGLSLKTRHTSIGPMCCLSGMRPQLSTWRRHMILLLSGGKMREIHHKDGLECAVWSYLRSEIQLVGLVCVYPMLSSLGRFNICLNPHLIHISLAVAPQYHREVLGKENTGEVRRLLRFRHPGGCLNLTMSQLFCPGEEGPISMTRTLKSLWRSSNRL